MKFSRRILRKAHAIARQIRNADLTKKRKWREIWSEALKHTFAFFKALDDCFVTFEKKDGTKTTRQILPIWWQKSQGDWNDDETAIVDPRFFCIDVDKLAQGLTAAACIISFNFWQMRPLELPEKYQM